MPFIEPLFLWGALAVVIPVAIHFWHQKQGKPLPWAAMQWLTEARQQQSRGLRLDNILLLLIRCSLLLLLAILLAKPLLNWFTQPPRIERVHLVQPSQAVLTNFRFELTEAQKKGERVVWANPKLSPVTVASKLPDSQTPFGPLSLQTAINQLDGKNTVLHLYLTPTQTLSDVPAITVPLRFRLHTAVDSTTQPGAYLLATGNRSMFINRAGKLIVSPARDAMLKFQSAPAHTGPIQTLIQYRDKAEQQTVEAALTALTDVYGLDIAVTKNPVQNQPYDLILTDQLPTNPSPQTLYLVSAVQQSALPNVVFSNETLTPQTSDRVAGGQLPEWLGLQILRHYGLETNTKPLSKQALNALFVPTDTPPKEQHAGIQQVLLLLLIGLLILERWLALTKNA
ncbi:BatA domain-containing protein [Spirosoma spitsbergense]|uniref:BatA domain-containing protein n=1 Tax=Spirosoma spitsbergense TaxID=431554 RepID=UPI000378558D|nr:BatA domain-containing protein [Spirosoma spitsbergense]